MANSQKQPPSHSLVATPRSSSRGRFNLHQSRSSPQFNRDSTSAIEASRQESSATTISPASTAGPGHGSTHSGRGEGVSWGPGGSDHACPMRATHSSPPSTNHQVSPSHATSLHGRICHLNVASGFGFLIPVISNEDQLLNTTSTHHQVSSSPTAASLVADEDPLCSSSSGMQENFTVYFKLPPTKLESHTSCHSGLMSLQVGDTLEYISDYRSERPRAIYTRLISCSSRSADHMASYLKCLLFHCLEGGHTDSVLHEITKAPIGLLLILEHRDPDRALVFLILKLAIAICDHCKLASSNTSRIKEFFRHLMHTPLFMTENGGLCKLLRRLQILSVSVPTGGFSATIESEWGKPLYTLVVSIKTLILQVLSLIPEELPFLVSLIQMLDQMQMIDANHETNSKSLMNGECSFAMQVIKRVAHASGVGSGGISISYEKLSLLPWGLEIQSASVGLPVAKCKGAYDSTEDYIDTYFRLLREDSFGSLRKGILDFLNDKLDHRDMTMWFGVSATGVHFQQYLPGLMVGLQLDYGQGNRPRPKLPLAGSLLCICDSGGSFENPMWAIAARSVETSKKKTVLFVEVLEGTPGVAREHFKSTSPWGRILQASSMVVAESPAYYRAYEPVLKALQRLDPETLPFQSELVSAKSPRKPPNYLNDSTILDWSCMKDQDSYGELKAGVHELAQQTLSGFQICLDNSQVDAVNHVLQNQLAMIQGPPGTGKTFLSVKIVELLLSANTRSQKPVLIVTYKNRALDQFLERCLQFCKPSDIVRVGGRSTDEKLDCCNLQHLLRTAERRTTSEWIANCKKLGNLQSELQRALSKLYGCQAFNIETITSHFSSQGFLSRLLSRSEKKPTPDVAEPTSTELSSDAVQSQHKILKEWIPRKAVFDEVKGLFAPKPSRRPRSQSSTTKSKADDEREEPDDLEEDNEDRNESESLWQDIKGPHQPGSKGKKELDWLTKNYLDLANLNLQNKLFTSQSLGNFDSNQYTWLLEEDPWELPEKLRCFLILVIMRRNLEACIKEFCELKSEYDAVCADNAEINNQKRIAILKEAKIIGMTTTGAAINQDIIAAVSPSIILVEESGEILEPHLLALLSANVEHLILIGDHKQLQPSVNCYELQTRHNLGISMLQRLAEHNKLPYQTLGLQSRMREEFLQMIKPIYPKLRSNLKVVNGARNQPTKCMKSTMYFWNHKVEETPGRSPINTQEAHMVVALAKWLLSEGHRHEEITVICAYNGQVSHIRKMLDGLKGEGDDAIDVQTIDRYQGSENRIVIVSLVRSNPEGKIGHLSAENRLCVTVSRARAGLYMCGDVETLTQKSPHWRVLIEYFKSQNCIGESIFLCCPRHPKTLIPLHHDHAKKFSPYVCAVLCNAPLACGHQCTKTCHYGNHPPCKIPVEHVFPSCKHSTTKFCSDSDAKLKCLEEEWVRLERCGHSKKCLCWEKIGNVASARMCEFPCRLALPCEHPCTLLCGQDCGSRPCPACARIEKIRAQKEKDLQIKQMKEKLLSIDRDIEKLKSEPESGRVFKELLPEGETAAEYRMVQDRTEKFIQPTHKSLPVVTRIQKVINAKLELNFLQAKRDLTDVLAPIQMLFHGTDDAGVEGITTTGFRLPTASKKNMFGVGCYFATDSSKSAQELYTKGSNKLLLCEVLLGRPWSVNSAKSDLNYKEVKNKGYDSVFSDRNSRASGGTEFDEYIVYNPSQAIPRYVVHYRSMDCLTPGLQDLFQNSTNTKFGRRALNADTSSAFNGVTTSDEMHFRLAESQFLRMCNNNKQKVEKVEYTWNQELKERYLKKQQFFAKEKKPTNEVWVFHGTTKESIDKIVTEGFKVGGQGVRMRTGAVYGSGVYTAANPEISIPYSSSSSMMLLSTALCGKLNEDYNPGASEDIFVFKQGDQLLPKYIVHFRSTS